MGLFGALTGVVKGRNKGGQSDTSKPFHTHSSESKSQNAGAAPAPVEKPQMQTYERRPDGGQQAPIFMGKGQTEKFSSLTDPSSVDRGGRTISQPKGIDPVGIEPAMNPPMGVPVPPDIDKQGVSGLYSPAKINLPGKQEPSNDKSYGKKATDRVKHKIKKK